MKSFKTYAESLLPLLLLTIHFITNGLKDGLFLVGVNEVLTVFLIISAWAAAVWLLSLVIFRQQPKAVTLAAILIFCFLYGRAVFSFFRSSLTHVQFFMALALLLIIAGFIVRRSSTTALLKFNRYLVILFSVLIVYECTAFFRQKDPYQFSPAPEMQKWTTSRKPNIYLLVFDEYQGNKGLDSAFHFQNSDLSAFLKEKGFRSAVNPETSYNTTFYAMLSLFRMDTLQFSGPDASLTKRGIVKANLLMAKENTAVQYLKDQGYQISVHSIFNVDGQPATGSPITSVTWSQTQVLRTFYGWCFDELFTHIPSNRIQKILQSVCARILTYNTSVAKGTLRDAEKMNGPRFVYSHFLLPRPPVLLNHLGKELPFSTAMKEIDGFQPSILHSYPDQIRYTNKLLFAMVDTISVKDPQALIIVVSDHGCRNVMGKTPGVFNIQWAMKAPGYTIDAKEEDLHLVNTFRILFNTIGGQQLPMKVVSPRIVNAH